MLLGPVTNCANVVCAMQVLDSFIYADQELLAQRPELANAEVFVHFQSSIQVCNCACVQQMIITN
jgi:hypothetical protein